MGGCLSVPPPAQQAQFSTVATRNEFELVIRVSKDLERLLEDEFHAQGKGLHEKITSVQHQLPQSLVKRMRFLATIRNKLVHEADFNAIPDRAGFVRAYEESKRELGGILQQRGSSKPVPETCRLA